MPARIPDSITRFAAIIYMARCWRSKGEIYCRVRANRLLSQALAEDRRSAFRASLRLARYCRELGLPETRRFFHNTALLAFQSLKPSGMFMLRFR